MPRQRIWGRVGEGGAPKEGMGPLTAHGTPLASITPLTLSWHVA